MSLQRVKELLAAWEAGTAMEDELAELRRLLPAVIEAAKRDAARCQACAGEGVVWHDFCHCEASENCTACNGSGRTP